VESSRFLWVLSGFFVDFFRLYLYFFMFLWVFREILGFKVVVRKVCAISKGCFVIGSSSNFLETRFHLAKSTHVS
jgi:hypothetical protein